MFVYLIDFGGHPKLFYKAERKSKQVLRNYPSFYTRRVQNLNRNNIEMHTNASSHLKRCGPEEDTTFLNW